MAEQEKAAVVEMACPVCAESLSRHTMDELRLCKHSLYIEQCEASRRIDRELSRREARS